MNPEVNPERIELDKLLNELKTLDELGRKQNGKDEEQRSSKSIF